MDVCMLALLFYAIRFLSDALTSLFIAICFTCFSLFVPLSLHLSLSGQQFFLSIIVVGCMTSFKCPPLLNSLLPLFLLMWLKIPTYSSRIVKNKTKFA